MESIARHYLYPAIWCWLMLCIGIALQHPEQLTIILGVKAIVMVGTLLVFEWRVPLRDEWGMSKRHFLRRDLPMIVVNSLCLAGVNYALVLLSISVATTADGPLAGQSLLLQVLVGLVAFEALQYGLHRFMHCDGNTFSRFLWRCHAIHHLPQQLYVVMHAVFHPVNAILVRLLVQLTPIWLFGFDPMAVFIYSSIIGLHGTISHLNLDMRLGPLNYVFVGPELHRYHHSSKSAEAVNYGAALSIFDQAFGTFMYAGGQQPSSLGLWEVDGYPGQHAPVAALVFPFRRGKGIDAIEPIDDC